MKNHTNSFLDTDNFEFSNEGKETDRWDFKINNFQITYRTIQWSIKVFGK